MTNPLSSKERKGKVRYAFCNLIPKLRKQNQTDGLHVHNEDLLYNLLKMKPLT